jgi:DNA-binding response OmpR family regulator
VEGHALSEGDAFLPKPYDQSELAAAVEAVLAEPASG